jgi:hypothetical protein
VKSRDLALITAAPLLLAIAFIGIELAFQPPAVADTLSGKLTPVETKLLDMSNDLAKFFTGLATSLLGAIAFYLGLGREKKLSLDTYARVLVVLISGGAVLCIFFGHLWVAGLRQQLVCDIWAPHSSQLVWSERLQYLTFIASLCWFGLLFFHLEMRDQGPS